MIEGIEILMKDKKKGIVVHTEENMADFWTKCIGDTLMYVIYFTFYITYISICIKGWPIGILYGVQIRQYTLHNELIFGG